MEQSQSAVADDGSHAAGEPDGEDVGGDGALSRDTIFFTLSNQRRRHALHYLKQHDDAVRLRDLTEQVAARENGLPREEVASNQRKTVYTSLRQTHLPALKKAGVVDYDDAVDRITLTPRAAELDVYLDVVGDGELSWGRYYLGLAVVAGLAVAAAWVGLYPFRAVGGMGYAALVVAALLASATAHVRYGRRLRLGGPDAPPGR